MMSSGTPESLFNALAPAREDKQLVSKRKAKKRESLAALP
jgi:hypothetical protein